MNELIAEINEQPWAILPSAMKSLAASIAAGKPPEGSAAPDAAARPTHSQVGAVAVVPVSGPIMAKDSLIARWFGLATSEALSKTVAKLAHDPSIGAIVLDMDTPGGTVSGVQECAAAIAAVRGTKKVVAVSNHMMASAGYWIGSAADEVVASPSSLTGSIGVISVHMDYSGAFEQAGIDPTILSAGKYKAEGNWYKPLDDEARASMQAMIDAYYDEFIKGVAANRGATPSEVRSGFGQGRVLMAKDAKAAGLVDRIETIEEVLARLTASKRAQSPRRRAESDLALLEAIHNGERIQ